MGLEKLSATSSAISDSPSIANDHTDAIHGEFSRTRRPVQTSVPSVGVELATSVAAEDQISSLSRHNTTESWLLASQEPDRSAPSSHDEMAHRSRKQTLTKDTLAIRTFITRTLLGAIGVTIKRRCSRPDLDDIQDHERYHYEHERSFWVLPAQWLLRLGFNYAYSFSTHDSSARGWQFSMKPINLVPDNAPIFEYSRQGDTEKVRDLISMKLASVRDVDSRGRTALHVSHSVLRLMKEGISQGPIDLTPVVSLPRKIITQSYAGF